eukprot:6899091-Alexandrium_andersonii.AAC.1
MPGALQLRAAHDNCASGASEACFECPQKVCGSYEWNNHRDSELFKTTALVRSLGWHTDAWG